MSSCPFSMHGYASDSFHYMPSQITVHIVTCVSRVELYHKIGQIFIISMVLFIKRNELCNFFSMLILLINIIICENNKRLESDLMSQFVKKRGPFWLTIWIYSFIVCFLSLSLTLWTVSLKKLVMSCPEATARPLQRITPTPRCDRFIWMESSEQTDSSNDPINGFSQYVKSLETLFTTHTYFIIIVK